MKNNNTQERIRPSRRRVDIGVGALVSLENVIYRITEVLDFNTVIGVAVESGRKAALAIPDLSPVEQEAPEFAQDLDEIPDDAWKKAKQRLEVISPFITLTSIKRTDLEARAKATGYGAATIYRWIQRFRGAGSLTGLIPHKRGWKKGKTRISPAVDAVITEVLNDFFLTPQRPTAQKAVIEVLRRCHKLGVKAPHPNTVRARISRIPERTSLRGRGYKEKAKNKFMPAAGKFPNADFPLAVVQIDHTPADIILVDDKHRKPIGRPWLTLAIDVYSRMIVGYYLSFDAPSATSIAMCVAHAILEKDEWLTLHGVKAQWPVWGFPRTIHVDNGSDFRSDTFRHSCLTYNILLEFRPVRQPRYGGHIERMLGTVLKEIHALPGTTFSSIKDKEGYDPDKHAVMTKSEFETWLVGWICNVYHERLHKGIGMSPRKKWEIGIFGNADVQGVGVPQRPTDRHTVLLDFLPAFHRTVQPFGVTIDSMTYYAEALRPWINAQDPSDHKRKRAFIFRRDTRDISSVWFWDPTLQEYFKIPFADQAMAPISSWELNQAKNKARQDGATVIHSSQILNALAELESQVDESTQRTKKARRQAQRRAEHKKGISPAAPIKASPPTQDPPPMTDDFSELVDGEVKGLGDIA